MSVDKTDVKNINATLRNDSTIVITLTFKSQYEASVKFADFEEEMTRDKTLSLYFAQYNR